MYKKILGSVVLACSLVMGSTVALAHGDHCGWGMNKMVESLKLDDAQKQKIKPVLENLKTTMQQDGRQMHDLSKQIRDQVNSSNMDQAKVNDLIDQKTKLLGDMMKAKASARNQIFSVLNDQQRAELKNKMMKMQEKMEARYKDCHDQD